MRDDEAELEDFVRQGGRVVVANAFMSGSISRANLILNWGGMKMIEEEKGLVTEGVDQIARIPYTTEEVDSVIFFRAAPIEIVDEVKAPPSGYGGVAGEGPSSHADNRSGGV